VKYKIELKCRHSRTHNITKLIDHAHAAWKDSLALHVIK